MVFKSKLSIQGTYMIWMFEHEFNAHVHVQSCKSDKYLEKFTSLKHEACTFYSQT